MRRRAVRAGATGGPLRVLHVVPFLGHGGMETGVMKLVTGCDPARVVADVCTLQKATAFRHLFSGPSELHELSRSSAFDLGMIRALARIMRARRIDVAHTHSWGTLVEGWLAARWAGVRHVVHGEHGTLQTRPANVGVQRLVWRHVDRLLAVSADLAMRMSGEIGIPTGRIQVIENGVDTEPYGHVSREEARARLGLDAEAFVTVSIGRLVPVKNYDLLVTAARALHAGGTRCQFLVAGDGPLRPELERRLASENLSGVVRLLGHRADIPTLLAAADVFVLTSWSEGMSNTILEAMAAGRPVVATHVGGNAELVLDRMTGMLVAPDRPAELVEALSRLASDASQAQRMGAAGRRRAVRAFSQQRMVEEYTQMYEDVAGCGSQVRDPGLAHTSSATAQDATV